MLDLSFNDFVDKIDELYSKGEWVILYHSLTNSEENVVYRSLISKNEPYLTQIYHIHDIKDSIDKYSATSDIRPIVIYRHFYGIKPNERLEITEEFRFFLICIIIKKKILWCIC